MFTCGPCLFRYSVPTEIKRHIFYGCVRNPFSIWICVCFFFVLEVSTSASNQVRFHHLSLSPIFFRNPVHIVFLSKKKIGTSLRCIGTPLKVLSFRQKNSKSFVSLRLYLLGWYIYASGIVFALSCEPNGKDACNVSPKERINSSLAAIL